jgi:hypothetical protein
MTKKARARQLDALRDGKTAWAAWHGECQALLADVPDDYFDLSFTSPPYEKRRRYGTLNFKLKGQAWVDWLVPIVLEMARVTNGLVCVNCQGETEDYRWSGVPHLLAADLIRAGLVPRHDGIYYRNGVSGSGGPDYFRTDHEYVLCFSKTRGRLPFADPTACGHPPKWAPGGAFSNRLPDGKRVNDWGSTNHTSNPRRDYNDRRQKRNKPAESYRKVGETRHATSGSANGDTKTAQAYTPPKIANPGSVTKAVYTAEDVAYLLAEHGVPGYGSVMHCLVGGGLMGDRHAHKNEAPFSIELPTRYIRSFCPPGGRVLDNFCGSGTTLKAAVIAGRRALGIDLRPEMVDLVRARLRVVSPELFQNLVKALATLDAGREDPKKIAEALARRILEEDLHESGWVSQLCGAGLPAGDRQAPADVPGALAAGAADAPERSAGGVADGAAVLPGPGRRGR